MSYVYYPPVSNNAISLQFQVPIAQSPVVQLDSFIARIIGAFLRTLRTAQQVGYQVDALRS